MKTMLSKQGLLKCIMAVITSAEIMVIGDIAAAFCEKAMPLWGFFLGLLGITALLILWRKCSARVLFSFVIGSCLLMGLCIVGLLGVWKHFSANACYQDVDDGKAKLYAGHNVMAFIPHQDDDLSLLGGVFEEYVKYGSTVRVVFVTAGDYDGIGETRMREALQVMESIGIPEENVIFLGFGNEWKDISSIYYGEPDEVLVSHNSRTESYGLPEHAAYQEETAYTRENLMQLITDVILEYQPDTLFSIDLDSHIDHRMVSFMFDETVGRVLAMQNDYRPAVFKGFSYPTALYAENDYYALNIRATKGPGKGEYLSDANIFRWSNRVRFPVNAGVLSRSLYSSKLYQETTMYASQYFHQRGGCLINGDRVFWQRETDSLLYDADISASSGDASILNDFCLIASDSEEKKLESPYSGVWIPASADREKTVTVTLTQKENLSRVVLYDSYSTKNNILNAEISFPSGHVYATGALHPDGSGTEIEVNEQNVSSFTVRITSSEGDSAGLAEIEAYTDSAEPFAKYIKLENMEGDFAYDYRLKDETSAEFSLYAVGCSSNPADYEIICDNDQCHVEIQNDLIVVECPKGQSCILHVTDADGTCSDSIVISHENFLDQTGRKLEETFSLNTYKYDYFRESALFSILRWVRHLFTSESLPVDLPGVL